MYCNYTCSGESTCELPHLLISFSSLCDISSHSWDCGDDDVGKRFMKQKIILYYIYMAVSNFLVTKSLLVIRPTRINHVSTKNVTLLYHNLISIYTITVKSLPLAQNLISIFQQFTETGYYFQN